MERQALPLNLTDIHDLACTSYAEARDAIRTGDLLFCSGAKPLSRIIQTATRSPYSHVALVVRMLSIDRVLLLEAEWPYGVRVVPLSCYFKDWNGGGKPYSGNLLVARHAALDADDADTLALFLSELVDILGRPYSLRRALRIGLREVVALAGLRFRELRLKKATVCSEYIHHAYARLGIHIPCNPKGYILPMDIASHQDVSLICRIL
ncbi:hypothetical protein SKTS_08190 [Sulfurimicrobium lacus]|uniref:Permuted papain-like amidase enzyme, YaeF/YiiX, C92 family n=1 Tax=Sulfurimicrobium lacus TaxID=2715678 RepID=A0A6F8V7W8_9PROT|nr:hypothetical protein [Sulfurimicrobium lacus]BCB25933.1 hypothetical protein SKTS_08190 [Sulfurimicrobium lacus]